MHKKIENHIPDWEKKGLEHIWLPYTQMKDASSPLPVQSTQGVTITLEDGRTLIDGIASWWSACHGYQHPHIIEQMHRQIDQLPHIMFAGFAHQPAYTLAQRLVEITPKGLDRVFFSDSGSTAVEVALKMAVQYWYNQDEKQKNKFICFHNSYHGDTMGCMSVADPDGMHSIFSRYMPKQYHMDLPNDEYSFDEFELLLDSIKNLVAGLIIEPLVQAAGGMKFHSPDILAEIHRLCKERNILFIVDEIATGFGRTGEMFACDEAAISPDIMCLGKSLTGGTISLAATLASKDIFDGFLSDTLEHAFMHGPTFMANPIACAAANASLDLFEDRSILTKISDIEIQLTKELAQCTALKNVADVRVKGAIGVVELEEITWKEIFAMRQKFLEHGVYLRPFGNVIYVMPSYTITKEELSRLTRSIFEVLSHG